MDSTLSLDQLMDDTIKETHQRVMTQKEFNYTIKYMIERFEKANSVKLNLDEVYLVCSFVDSQRPYKFLYKRLPTVDINERPITPEKAMKKGCTYKKMRKDNIGHRKHRSSKIDFAKSKQERLWKW